MAPAASRTFDLPKAYAYAREKGLAFPPGIVACRTPDGSPDARKIYYGKMSRSNPHWSNLYDLYVYDLESTQAIRMRANLGERKPALCTAEGRAVLAFRPEAEVEALIAQGFRPRTPKTITEPDKLRAALAEVRRVGFAREDEQSELGMRSIAAPIRDASGDVVAAVGMAGPMQRLSDKVLAQYAPQVAETARVISTRLGYKAVASFE